MILFENQNPNVSIYYLSAIIIDTLNEFGQIKFEKLYDELVIKTNQAINIDDLYYSLDWLYLLSLINVMNDKVILCL